jgi:hypothetical protein
MENTKYQSFSFAYELEISTYCLISEEKNLVEKCKDG